jgi:hypothetical protein
MSDMKDGAATAGGAPDHIGDDRGHTTAGPVSEQPSTVWAGWAFFAGVMMVIVGVFQLIKALTALFNQHYLLVTGSGLAVHVDISAWGWAHLVIGLVLIASGYGVVVGKMWGRVLGIILTAVSAIVNLLDIAAYPLWSIIIIAVDVVIIYALAVHGSDLKSV